MSQKLTKRKDETAVYQSDACAPTFLIARKTVPGRCIYIEATGDITAINTSSILPVMCT